MKNLNLTRIALIFSMVSVLASCSQTETENSAKSEKKSIQSYGNTTEIPVGITTPNKVETSIGTLNFFDGVPTKTNC